MAETEEDSQKAWTKAANTIIKAGVLPFPVTDTLMQILKYYLNDQEVSFIAKAFKLKPSQTMEQLVKSSKGMTEPEIKNLCDGLAKKGFIFNQPSSTGVMVYRLLPLVIIGAFEYTFMQPIPDNKKVELANLAKLYEKLMNELRDAIQGAYDNFLPIFQNQPAVDRTVPVYENVGGSEIPIEHVIEAVGEQIVIAKNVEDIIKKFDDIAVGNCFCRNYREMLGHKCKINAPKQNCFTFGKSARHVINQGFGKRVAKEEALKILKEAEDAGLVHKAFHNKSDIKEEENSICNCCPDCCDTFNLWKEGATPLVNYSMYLAHVNADACTGCGTCESKCPVGAAVVGDNEKASINEKLCIGCGVCAHFCPEVAISLKEKPRTVFLPPPRIKA
nr:4Fe-4S binding protein [Candidatus Sigynarchaeota archaeon]